MGASIGGERAATAENTADGGGEFDLEIGLQVTTNQVFTHPVHLSTSCRYWQVTRILTVAAGTLVQSQPIVFLTADYLVAMS